MDPNPGAKAEPATRHRRVIRQRQQQAAITRDANDVRFNNSHNKAIFGYYTNPSLIRRRASVRPLRISSPVVPGARRKKKDKKKTRANNTGRTTDGNAMQSGAICFHFDDGTGRQRKCVLCASTLASASSPALCYAGSSHIQARYILYTCTTWVAGICLRFLQFSEMENTHCGLACNCLHSLGHRFLYLIREAICFRLSRQPLNDLGIICVCILYTHIFHCVCPVLGVCVCVVLMKTSRVHGEYLGAS